MQEPKPPLRNWERITAILALIAAAYTAQTNWFTNWQFLNERRDMILGIGHEKPLHRDLAIFVFNNDWKPTAESFFWYALGGFVALWIIVFLWSPMREAILNPFETKIKSKSFTGVFWVIASITTLAVIIKILYCLNNQLNSDAANTTKFIAEFCPTNDVSPTLTGPQENALHKAH